MLKVNERNPKEMAVITKAKDLMEHSCKMTANTNHFPKKYRFSIGARIENIAIDIYENLVRANECDINDAVERRSRYECQKEAIVSCKLLNTMIELAYKLKTIELEMKSVAYWSGLVVEVKRMTAAWRNSDKRNSSHNG